MYAGITVRKKYLLSAHPTHPGTGGASEQGTLVLGSVSSQNKASGGLYGMPLPASPGSCPYLDGVLGSGRTEVSVQNLDSFKELGETLRREELGLKV